MLSAMIVILGMASLVMAVPNSEEPILAKRAGGFSGSCTNIYLNSWTLEAQCQAASGSYSLSRLDLGGCLANGAGGYVVCEIM
jgi:hypothetical protein